MSELRIKLLALGLKVYLNCDRIVVDITQKNRISADLIVVYAGMRQNYS